MGIKSDGSIHDDVWAVADMRLDTDFPDRRRRTTIRSPAGALMMIPNPGDLNRIYTQLSSKEAASLGGVDESQFEKPETRLMTTKWKDTEMLQILQIRLKTGPCAIHRQYQENALDQPVSYQTTDRQRFFRWQQGLCGGSCLPYPQPKSCPRPEHQHDGCLQPHLEVGSRSTG